MATLVGSGGFTWFTSSNDVGTSASGYSSTYDTGLQLKHNLPGYEYTFYGPTETTEDLGREIVYGPEVSGGVSVTRKQYVPTDQTFARFLESFTNTGIESKTFTVKIHSNIYSDSATVVTATSSGDTLVTAADKWIVVDNNGGSYNIPAAAHVFAGAGAPVPPSAVTISSEDDEDYSFSLTLAPGETRIILHFASLADDAATAAANAAALAALPAYALSGMSAAELAGVVNFNAGYIFKSVSYTLLNGELNLQLTGSANINGTGNASNNILVGNSGNNTLNGMGGNDTMAGGLGNDTYVVNVVSDVVTEELNAGTDLVQSTAGTHTLSANVENLTLLGTSAINGIGNTLNNVLTGNSGNNVLNGSTGTDTASYANAAARVTVNLGLTAAQSTFSAGSDTLTLIENLTGSAFNDTLTGNSGNNVLNGGLGNDTMKGGAGNDTYAVNVGTDVVTELSGAGTDLVQASLSYSLSAVANVENLALLGTANINGTGNTLSNVLTGNTGNNILNGGSGNDTLNGGLGNDTLIGGAGNDIFVVNFGTDVVTEALNAGADTVQASLSYSLGAIANVENLTLLGTANIYGTGNALNNVLTGNSGNNALNGGAGIDTASYAGAAAGVTVSLGVLIAQNTVGAGSDTLTSIENLTGSAFNDKLTGNSGNNVLNGSSGTDTASYANAAAGVTVNLGSAAQNTVGAGTDTLISIANLTGSAYNDTLTGNSGANFLDGGIGADTMAGGLGNDTYVRNATGDMVTEGPNAGTDTVQSAVTYTLGANVENLTLTGTAAINGTGNTLNNIIIGNNGNNVLNGGGGNDTLLGQDGNDRFILSAGNDVISGGAGNDTIVVDEGFGTVEIRDTLGIEYIDFSAVGTPITVNLTPGSVNSVAGGTLKIFQGGAVSEPLDLVFLQDLSGSFGDDIASVRGLVPTIATAVQVYQPDTRFGVTSHVDKAIDGHGSGSDYVYRTDLALTASLSQLQATYNGLSILGGNDTPESQIEALMQIALRNTEVGWRGNALKVVLVMTDADYHRAGDSPSLPANDGDAVLEGTPAGTGEDYPTVELLRQKLIAADILPIFAVTSDNVANYQDLIDQLGFGEVVSLNSNSADIVTAIQTGLNKATAAKIDRILGTAFADSITGSQYDNFIDGGAGADTMTGGLGDDTYVVGTGDSVVENAGAGTGADTVQTALNNYTLGANVENLTLLGAAGINGTGNTLDNVLTGNSANNILNGGSGNDTLNGGLGNDTMIGGAGNDIFVVNVGTDVVTEAPNAGTDLVQSTAAAYTLSVNVENLTLLGTAAINGTGNTLNNVLTGNSGNNVLNGGSGTDTASYASAAAGVTVNLALTAAQNTVGAGTDTLTLIENLTGSAFNDTLTGNTLSNVLEGGAGNDTLNGGSGTDTASYASATAGVTVNLALTAAQNTFGAGTDTLTLIENLTGGAFNDYLTGNTGNNVLSGGGGNDTLTGGTGLDAFRFDAAPGSNIDQISGFVVVDDTIQLENAVFTSLITLGTLAPGSFRAGAGLTAAADADDFLIYNTSNGALYYDAGGNAGAASQQIASLSGVPAILASDFFVT